MGVLRYGSYAIIVSTCLLASCSKAPKNESGASKHETSSAMVTSGVEPGKWTQDYKAALAEAKAKNLPVLLSFVGSDWCPMCALAEKQIFSKPDWKAYAKDHLVLVKLDFPQKKKLPEKVVERNQELEKKYQIEGYPFFVLLDSDGKALGKFGFYQDDDPKSFVARVKKTLADPKAAVASGETQPVKLQGTEIHAAVGKGEDVKFLDSGCKDGMWTQDVDAAKDEAAKTKKPLLFMFTGSDWCPGCLQMAKLVLSQASWQRFARENLILVALDFPRSKTQSEAIAARNRKLQDKYEVGGYPTFLLIEPDGQTLIANIDPATSPRDFRKNIQAGLRYSRAAIEKLAKQMDPESAKKYRDVMARLIVEKQKETQVLNKAQRLYQMEALTDDVQKQLDDQRKLVRQLEGQAELYEKELFAKNLEIGQAGRYLKLYSDYRKAQKDYIDWLETRPEQNPENMGKMRSHQQTMRVIKDAMADIENAHTMSRLPEARAKRFREILKELRSKQEYRRRWLESDPANTPENIKKDAQLVDELNQLEDRLDAIRDS